MIIRDLMMSDSKIFVKSEFAPASDYWPVLSFSRHKIARDFSNVYRRGNDYVIYIGTSSSEQTENPAHRQSLLSIISVEPGNMISTKDIVPPETWRRVLESYGERWEWSLPIDRAMTIKGFPRANAIMPITYRQLGVPKNFGRCVEILESEVANILDIEIEPIVIKLTNEARRIRFLNVNNDLLRKELSRLVALISCDIKRSGSDKNGIYPQRKGPNDSDLFAMLNEKWSVQKGSCALCGVEIPLETKNKLLQMSRDRIDSLDKSYESYNIQITHCGCNLAKNDVSMEEWREYVTLLRSFSG